MMEEDKIHKFLMGLEDKLFSTMRSQMLGLDTLPSLAKIFNMFSRRKTTRRC